MGTPALAKLRQLQEHAQNLLQGREISVLNEDELSPGRRFLLFCARVYHSFVRNRCPVRAAALAYTNLLALVPLLAVVVSVSAGLLKSQGEQSIQDWIREAITRVAPTLGLKAVAADKNFLFAADDLPDRDFDRLVNRLEGGNYPLSRYLWDNRFDAQSKNVLTNQTLPLDDRKRVMAVELNKVVKGPPIYQEQRFAKIQLSPKTRALQTKNPEGQDLARLNYSLLSDAYHLADDPLDTVVSQITGFVANFQSGKLGVTAVLALVFVAISLLSTVETTFNDIWGVTRGRGWFARVVQYWAALTLGPMFLLSAVTLTTWAKVSQQIVQELPMAHFFAHFFMPFLVPLTILSLGCALLYLAMPNIKVPWQAALLGGSVAGALIQLNSYFNVMYVSRVLTYKQIYGSMAALPLFLVGLYLSWLLVLFGAQVTYAYQNRHAYVQEKKAENVNQRGREFVALRLMALIGQRFQTGARPATGSEMSDDLKVPLRLIGQIMSLLLQTGLVVEVAGPELAYAPARPLDQITIRDLLQAVRTAQGQELTTCDDPAKPVVVSQFEAVERAWQTAASGVTLDQVVREILQNERRHAEEAKAAENAIAKVEVRPSYP